VRNDVVGHKEGAVKIGKNALDGAVGAVHVDDAAYKASSIFGQFPCQRFTDEDIVLPDKIIRASFYQMVLREHLEEIGIGLHAGALDEFITLEEPYKTISDVLSEFQDYDAVLIQWMNYGANGHVYKPDYAGRDYREFYTKRADDANSDAFFSINTKVVWNMRHLTRDKIGGIHCGNGFCKWVKTNFIQDRKIDCYDKMYLKHYVTRSFEEYIWKIFKRGMHCYDKHRSIKDFFQINPDMEDRKEELLKIKDNILNV
jgi:hypothetical protein